MCKELVESKGKTANVHVSKILRRFGDVSFFFFFFLTFIFETERDRALTGEGQRERETQNLKQTPGSELSAQSPTRGLNSRTARS